LAGLGSGTIIQVGSIYDKVKLAFQGQACQGQATRMLLPQRNLNWLVSRLRAGNVPKGRDDDLGMYDMDEMAQQVLTLPSHAAKVLPEVPRARVAFAMGGKELQLLPDEQEEQATGGRWRSLAWCIELVGVSTLGDLLVEAVDPPPGKTFGM
jgi:hypothetical protein